jgi:diacylglycerol kinase (ATP)
MQTGPFSVLERLASFRHAFRGLSFFVRSQHNAWIHAAGTVIVVTLCCFLKLSAADWSLIILAMMAVWVTEALNTAIERLTDLVSPEFHPLAGQVKDIAAAAVLISAFGAVLVGGIILVPRVLPLF